MRPSDLFERIDPESPLRRLYVLGSEWTIGLSDYAGIVLLVATMALAGIAVALR